MPVLSNGAVLSVGVPQNAPSVVVRPPETPQKALVVRGGRGEQGVPGASGSAAFEHTQSAPSSSWAIDVPEEMGRTPNVAVYIDGRLVLADVEANPSTVNITFPAPIAGSVVLA